ncbi:MAG: EF-Tu/IF-2/RF-3 family GTPase [Nanoarchaeota archaeon]|nr:EF-Tu/IF-2/RF-3 family GTPase [Nanoarchaeota archaeon]
MTTSLLFYEDREGRLNDLKSKLIESIEGMNVYLWKDKNEIILTAEDYPKTINTVLRILSISENAILYLNELSAYTAELAIALEYSDVKNKVIVYDDEEVLKKFREFFKKYKISQAGCININDKSTYEPIKHEEKEERTVMSIDKNFVVKGIGDVAIGFIVNGSIKKGDHLFLLPSKDKIVIKNIQIMDVDVNEARAGEYVGLALGGTNEMKVKNSYFISSDDAIAKYFEVKTDVCELYGQDIFNKQFSCAVFGQNLKVTLTSENGKTKINFDYFIPEFSSLTLADSSLRPGKNRIVGKVITNKNHL